MTDTRVLLDKITAFRQRLESMPRLVPQPTPNEAPPQRQGALAEGLEEKVRAGSRTQALLESSLRQLTRLDSAGPCPNELTARAKRVLGEAKEIVARLRTLADHPLLAGPPPGPDGAQPDVDPLCLHYRETAAPMESGVRLASAFPDAASVQLRLCDGIEAILDTARRRLADLHQALAHRAHDAGQVDTLAHLLTCLDAGKHLDEKPFIELAEALLGEDPSTPLRLLSASPSAKQAFLGGRAFDPPVRFVACHSLSVARVLARMIHNDPVWSTQPLPVILSALVHDIGMLRVPLEIIGATEPLSDEQRRQLEVHAGAGAELVVERVPALAMLAEPIAHHHERLDGTGYPSGLREGQLSSLARLVAVADVYAALSCPRPHRTGRDPRTALTDTLLLGDRAQLDRTHAQRLMKLGLYPAGSVVELADRSVGVVVANHPAKANLNSAARPVLALLTSPERHILPSPRYLDLAETEHGSVVRTLSPAERSALLARHYPQWAV
jgi:HD domain